MTDANKVRRAAWLVFLLGAVVIGGTVAGPGLTWDEPAYRGSQTLVQQWWRELVTTHDPALLGAEEIGHYWEFNRYGPNFHPPMASYFNLAGYALFGWLIDDLSARRLASALQFAALAGILCRFIGKRWGLWPGLFAGLSLLFLPRLVGDAHLVGTDVTMLFFWTITALLFWKSLEEPRWRWWFGAAAGGLFLTKFSGMVLVVPLGLWVLGLLWRHRRWLGTWLSLSLQILIPLVPAAVALIGGEKLAADKGLLGQSVGFVFAHDRLFSLTLLWPALRLLLFRRPADWPRVLEIPWAALAVAPLVAAALNPTWWHDTLHGLARYFDLNLHREGKLPEIGIFYLGQRYGYSLPWHNGFVLLAVTVPFGTLLLGLIGALCVFVRRDSLGLFVLLQSLTLIVFRMFPTPAHDGVRLFLPTFLFLAALAAYGAMTLARDRRWWWRALFIIGPGLAAAEWAAIHPLELSYYNVGLHNATRLGFEATYWYDAVTPRFLNEINEKLPQNANLVVQVDALINPEVLFALQSMGRLRGDVNLQPAEDSLDNWVLLLTHSSKATPFTKVLYALSRHESLTYRHDRVRLVTVMQPQIVNTALAATLMAVKRGASSRDVAGVLTLEPTEIFEPAFKGEYGPKEWIAAVKALETGERPLGPSARKLFDEMPKNVMARRFLPRLHAHDSEVIQRASKLLTDDGLVHRAVKKKGYLTEEEIAVALQQEPRGSIDRL